MSQVRLSVLGLLEEGARRYSELVKLLKRPDKTVHVTLRSLALSKLVAKDAEGKYVLTTKGRQELVRMRLVRAVEREDNPEVVIRLSESYLALTKGPSQPEKAHLGKSQPWREQS